MNLNYYKLLNVPTNANEKEIKKAYRNLAKKYHPDMYQGDKSVAEEKMQLINEAYDTLSNTELRKEYDKKIGLYKEPEINTSTNNNYNTTSSYRSNTTRNYNNVKYRPNNSNTYYDNYGYAETNYTSYTGDRYTRNKYEERINLDKKDVVTKICILLAIAIFILVGLIKLMSDSISEIKNVKQQIYSTSSPKVSSTQPKVEAPVKSPQNNAEKFNSADFEDKKADLQEELSKIEFDEEKFNELLNEFVKALEEYKASVTN